MNPAEARRRDQALIDWIEANLGGRVTWIEPMARWRTAWNIDLELDGRIIPLHARAERELNFAIPVRLADEVVIHDLMEAHGLPVPHAYGICPEPKAMVMDRLDGFVDLTFAADDAERHQLLDEYLGLLPAVYSIPLDAAAAAGFEVPTEPRDIALGTLRRTERTYDELMPRPDPVAVFLRKWLHANAPTHRREAVFLTHDAFQFMFAGGRITGLLDFELAIVGDPLMDLGALRVRDTIKNLGDLAAIGNRFAEVTGFALDHDVIDYHAVLYNTLTVLSAGPPLVQPEPTTDYISHLAWYVNSARWAFEVIAELRGWELEVLEAPPAANLSRSPIQRHLVDSIRTLAVEPSDEYSRWCLRQLARHLQRVDEIGEQLAWDDLEDVAQLLGEPVDRESMERDLIAFIDAAGPDHDEVIVRTLDRMVQRRHLTMAPLGSLMLRHPLLRSLRPERQVAVTANSGWPAGAIPGTN